VCPHNDTPTYHCNHPDGCSDARGVAVARRGRPYRTDRPAQRPTSGLCRPPANHDPGFVRVDMPVAVADRATTFCDHGAGRLGELRVGGFGQQRPIPDPWCVGIQAQHTTRTQRPTARGSHSAKAPTPHPAAKQNRIKRLQWTGTTAVGNAYGQGTRVIAGNAAPATAPT